MAVSLPSKKQENVPHSYYNIALLVGVGFLLLLEFPLL
jgi:hypothetical protein